MIHSRFSLYILISSFFLTTSFLECPPKRRTAICPALAGDLMQLAERDFGDDVESDEDGSEAGEDDGATGSPLRVDISKLVEEPRPHLNSDSTAASRWSADEAEDGKMTEDLGGSVFAASAEALLKLQDAAREKGLPSAGNAAPPCSLSMRGEADEAEDGKMTEDLGGAVVAASAEALLKLQDEARKEGLPSAGVVDSRVTEAPVLPMPSVRLAARHCDRGVVGEDTDSDEVAVSGGAGVASGGRRTCATDIDSMCKKIAWEGLVDPFKAGEEKGIEAFAKLALNPIALFKCICDCDHKCGKISYFDPTFFESIQDRQKLKLIKFWRSFQRVIIACLPAQLRTGVGHGILRFKIISKKGSADCIAFVQQCDERLNECFNPCFSLTNKPNLLYWAACKLTFVACFFENSPIKKRADYFELGRNDGFNKIYISILSDLVAHCEEVLAHYKKCRLASGGVSTDPRASAMFRYWQGFKAGLEQVAKIADE